MSSKKSPGGTSLKKSKVGRMERQELTRERNGQRTTRSLSANTRGGLRLGIIVESTIRAVRERRSSMNGRPRRTQVMDTMYMEVIAVIRQTTRIVERLGPVKTRTATLAKVGVNIRTSAGTEVYHPHHITQVTAGDVTGVTDADEGKPTASFTRLVGGGFSSGKATILLILPIHSASKHLGIYTRGVIFKPNETGDIAIPTQPHPSIHYERRTQNANPVDDRNHAAKQASCSTRLHPLLNTHLVHSQNSIHSN
ncbi:hypothetical protein C8R48DRAFT_790042 [Suillus tomentosus]|nr:hypothetical protein C8R48DRAFT_790042 [Suillus tomentosus]